MQSLSHKIAPLLLVSGLLISQLALPALAAKPEGAARYEVAEQRLLDQLGLTPQQRHRIEAIKQQAKTEAKGYHDQLKDNRQNFEAYLFSPDAKQSAAEAKVDEFSALMSRMGKLRVRTLFKMREVMTPQQFQKFGKLQQERFQERMRSFKSCHAHGVHDQ